MGHLDHAELVSTVDPTEDWTGFRVRAEYSITSDSGTIDAAT